MVTIIRDFAPLNAGSITVRCKIYCLCHTLAAVMFWLLFVCLYVNSETQTVMGGFQKQADYGPDNSW